MGDVVAHFREDDGGDAAGVGFRGRAEKPGSAAGGAALLDLRVVEPGPGNEAFGAEGVVDGETALVEADGAGEEGEGDGAQDKGEWEGTALKVVPVPMEEQGEVVGERPGEEEEAAEQEESGAGAQRVDEAEAVEVGAGGLAGLATAADERGKEAEEGSEQEVHGFGRP